MARMMMTPAAALPLRAVLADDERLPREQLRAALARAWPELEIVGEASHGAQARSLLVQLPDHLRDANARCSHDAVRRGD